MADEIKARSRLQIFKTDASGEIVLKDWGLGVDFTADMDGNFGPAPGAMVATTEGADVDLSAFTTPGFVFVKNDDDTNYVEVGVFDPETNVFYPFLELGPGEGFPLKLSRNFGEEYAGTGTGTSAPTNTLRVKANAAPCNVFIGCFER